MRMVTTDLLRRHPWVVRIGLALALAVGLGYGPHRAAGGADQQIDKLRRQLSDTREAIAATERENARLRERVRALKDDPGAIEDVARTDLGLVFPGEVVIDLGGARAPSEEDS